MVSKKKKTPVYRGLNFLKGGLDRIRTDVDGFADHCLATRPRDLIFLRRTKLQFQIKNTIYSSTITETYLTSPSIGGFIFCISTLHLRINEEELFNLANIR